MLVQFTDVLQKLRSSGVFKVWSVNPKKSAILLFSSCYKVEGRNTALDIVNVLPELFYLE